MPPNLRCFMTKNFAKWAKKEGLTSLILHNTAFEFDQGLGVVKIRENLYKIRVAKPGGGKSGGYRVILAYKTGHDIFFLYGFSKSEQANLSQREENDLTLLAEDLLAYTESDIQDALEDNAIKALIP
ncbi:MAG: type II toxin-antitoxin system RelE/ParE family toxin [Candidatus Symbiobacter sp.]|nr:type II toxin-antitoxin system RelE/ParE family toxin [Candidatus Symbiobacter sp.]